MLKETNHDYQGGLCGNYYNNETNGTFESWNDFKTTWQIDNFDDTYNFIFRYDIHKQDANNFCLELCIMLQRKGIYAHVVIENISSEILNAEIKHWLAKRYDYIQSLWTEMLDE